MTNRLSLLSLSVSILMHAFFVTSNGDARDNWPNFHGPSGSGASHSQHTLDTLSPESIAWTAPLTGRGLSGPVVDGDNVFLTASSGPEQDRLHVLCFDTHTGKKNWERTFRATGRTMCHEKTSVATPTACTNGNKVCVLFSSNDLFCLDVSGNLLWLRGITLDYPNVSNSLGMSSSLVMIDDTVIAQVENDSESYTLGVDLETGLNRWRMNRPKAANWTSPIDLGNGTVGLQSKNGLDAVIALTGKIAWQYEGGASTIPSSCRMGTTVFVPSHGITALEYSSTSQSGPEQLWQTSRLSPGTPSPVATDKMVLTISKGNVLTAGDVRDGKRLWQSRLKGPFSATPVILGSLVICVNEDGLIQVIDIQQDGELLTTFAVDEQILASPAAVDDGLYLRSDATLWKLHLQK